MTLCNFTDQELKDLIEALEVVLDPFIPKDEEMGHRWTMLLERLRDGAVTDA